MDNTLLKRSVVVKETFFQTDEKPKYIRRKKREIVFQNKALRDLLLLFQHLLLPLFLKGMQENLEREYSNSSEVTLSSSPGTCELIQYQILRTNIIRILWQTARRITKLNVILGVKRLNPAMILVQCSHQQIPQVCWELRYNLYNGQVYFVVYNYSLNTF